MASRSVRSRCVSGKSVAYLWAGESLGQTMKQGKTISRMVASWFVDKAANQELANGNIDFRRFDKCKIKLEAFLEEKLVEQLQSHDIPAMSIVPLSIAALPAQSQ